MIDHLDKMFKGEEWNISFAGCGFSSLYYLGALSCILEHAPHLVRRASKIGGASSGCLVAASLVVGIPIETCCEYVMSMALAARRHQLSVLHPAFSLLGGVQDSLLRYLPPDAHLWASGRLCVSLTRLSDGENLLVTEFDNREELIQVLLCSCFFPLYCGVTPPSYRGVRYVDGALSNNMPLHDQRNTITVSPFCGEADICPREGGLGVLAVHYGDLGIRVSQLNVKRIYRSFFPPEPAELAEMSHNGYMDALRFLRRNAPNLSSQISLERNTYLGLCQWRNPQPNQCAVLDRHKKRTTRCQRCCSRSPTGGWSRTRPKACQQASKRCCVRRVGRAIMLAVLAVRGWRPLWSDCCASC
ncbi:patatin-like phospholipase domain-containing protein 2 isoform X2 [Gadus macrocephalus]|uniref:patatin-like phospholipase domain-containing protein 2 isoform X2 n=1 Tax=Gadus macrocephalus TaxID=80720 RepID=UPI0028CB94C6|nr:patatin-like phospholipase domain-containing protein 2 isoform X2 [Gadus macrocephalus]